MRLSWALEVRQERWLPFCVCWKSLGGWTWNVTPSQVHGFKGPLWPLSVRGRDRIQVRRGGG